MSEAPSLPHLPPYAFAIIIALVYAFLHFSWRLSSRRRRRESNNFRPSSLWYAIAAGNGIIGCIFLLGLWRVPQIILGDIFFFGGPAVIFFAIGIGLIFTLTRTRVEFTDTHLLFQYGLRSTIVELSKIKYIYRSGGYIVISTGEKYNTIIPAIFSDMQGLYAKIRNPDDPSAM